MLVFKDVEVLASPPPKKPWILLAWLALLAVLLPVFYPALFGPWLLDDSNGILNNSEFRHFNLPNLIALFRGHRDVRAYDHHPVPGFTALVDYQWSGTDPFGYHISNLVYHWLTAGAILLLFLAVWKIIQAQRGKEWQPLQALAIGATIMTLWAVHPYSTMAIGYVTCRQETIMVLFYVLALYALVRNLEGASLCLAIAAFLSKEVAVTLPGALFLFDWAVGNQSILTTFRRRTRFYSVLTTVWLFLCYWHWRGGRSQHVLSTGMPLASGREYFKAQCGVIADYVAKFFWPSRFQFYPYIRGVESWTEWMPYLIGILLYIAFAIYSLRWSRWLAVTLIFPLLVLLPTSSFIPIPYEPAMEYRMYLPSAALISLLVLVLWHYAKPVWAKATIFGAMLLALSVVSHMRCRDYETAVKLFEQQISVDPRSLTGLEALSGVYSGLGMPDNAEKTAIKLVDWGLEQKSPDFAGRGLNLLGIIAYDKRDHQKAKELFRRAIDTSGSPPAMLNLATTMVLLYELKPAEVLLAQLLRDVPDNADALLMMYEAKMSGKDYAQAEIYLDRLLAYYPERNDELDVQRTRLMKAKRGEPDPLKP